MGYTILIFKKNPESWTEYAQVWNQKDLWKNSEFSLFWGSLVSWYLEFSCLISKMKIVCAVEGTIWINYITVFQKNSWCSINSNHLLYLHSFIPKILRDYLLPAFRILGLHECPQCRELTTLQETYFESALMLEWFSLCWWEIWPLLSSEILQMTILWQCFIFFSTTA